MGTLSKSIIHGQAARLKLPLTAAERRGRAGAVVIVQEGTAGPILGAGTVALDSSGA